VLNNNNIYLPYGWKPEGHKPIRAGSKILRYCLPIEIEIEFLDCDSFSLSLQLFAVAATCTLNTESAVKHQPTFTLLSTVMSATIMPWLSLVSSIAYILC